MTEPAETTQLSLLPEAPSAPWPDGARHLRGHLDAAAQGQLLTTVLAAVEPAGWYTPTMPRSGAPLSVRMCNLGPLGWMSDKAGYRYQPHHPVTGRPWPPIPAALLALWRDVAGYPHPPECCLVNLYRGDAKLGLHQDADEAALQAPVVSVSLGDRAIFRLGGTSRRAPTRRLMLESGDVVVLGGPARQCFHGIDRVLAGTSGLVPGGGRINLTLRRVTRPEGEPG
jgi:DNA oxidative demethylase